MVFRLPHLLLNATVVTKEPVQSVRIEINCMSTHEMHEDYCLEHWPPAKSASEESNWPIRGVLVEFPTTSMQPPLVVESRCFRMRGEAQYKVNVRTSRNGCR